MTNLIHTTDIISKNDELRISDTILAHGLGYKSTKELRQLVERNRIELETYGEIVIQEANYLQLEESFKKRTGPKATEYLLNEHQALIIATMAKTAQAAALRSEMVKTFIAVKKRQTYTIWHGFELIIARTFSIIIPHTPLIIFARNQFAKIF